jgi:hypothetical protein
VFAGTGEGGELREVVWLLDDVCGTIKYSGGQWAE